MDVLKLRMTRPGGDYMLKINVYSGKIAYIIYYTTL